MNFILNLGIQIPKSRGGEGGTAPLDTHLLHPLSSSTQQKSLGTENIALGFTLRVHLFTELGLSRYRRFPPFLEISFSFAHWFVFSWSLYYGANEILTQLIILNLEANIT